MILRAALGAFAFDVAIRQEHAFDGIVELFNFAGGNQLIGFKLFVDALREFDIFWRMSGMPVVKAHQKLLPILIVLGAHARNQRVRRDALAFSAQHDRRAMCITRAYKIYFMAPHALKAHPNIAIEHVGNMTDV